MNLVVAKDAAAHPGSLLVDRYFVETLLGSGTYGRVLRALDTGTGKTVALKEFSREHGQSGRFLQELGVLFDLRHPSVIACDSLVMAGRYRYLVCEYMEGGTLREAIFAKTFPPSVLAGLLVQVADGIAYAHERGILHRDLKPENVLLTRRTGGVTAKVSDFGIAALVGSADAQSCIGSPAYMAPEQFSDQYDERVDQYALGVMLFEVVCGARPFRGSPAELLALHLRKEPEVFSWVPRLLSRILRRALAKRPERRFASVAHFADALRLALAHEASEIDKDGWAEFPQPRAILSLVGRTVVSARDGLFVLDGRGRVVDSQAPADSVMGAEDFLGVRRAERLSIRSSRSARTLDGIPREAKLALSAEGTVAFEYGGQVVLVDERGRHETLAARAAHSPCFVGVEQTLAWFERRGGRDVLRIGSADLELSGTVHDVCPSASRFELVARDAEHEGRVHLVRLSGVGSADVPGGSFTTDGETYYAVTDDGSLASLNCSSAKVARTRLDSPITLVGAGPDGVVCATSHGRIVRFS